MTIKEVLLTKEGINLASIAKKMYPTNKSAATYLNRKLRETDGRSFTEKNAENALHVLLTIGRGMEDLELNDHAEGY